ncbi:MAG: radical SAM family heme chaperone HemW [Acidimicrobiia bacterium]
MSIARFGVYVHVPFCASRCDYCDFATWTDRGHLIGGYVDACVRDVERRALAPATSVFFGGGTPSLVEAAQLVRILDAIPRAPGAEVTVECNPDSVDRAKLDAYAAAGVNRLSLGVQSMRTHVLALLGRTHDPANVTRTVEWARASGFTNINLDLIYGTPGESVDDWKATLDGALALGPSHVSAYALTVEPGTPLGRAVAAGDRVAPDDDDQAVKYELADDRLHAAGLQWYEISNWARPGHECRHNLLYWSQGEYVGIGCAAHGHTLEAEGWACRWWNVRTPDRYLTAIAAGNLPEVGHERLDPGTREGERLTLGLRTRDGIKLERASAERSPVGLPPVDACIDELAGAGLLEVRGEGATLTRRGRLLANEVTARLLASLDASLGDRAGAPAGTR